MEQNDKKTKWFGFTSLINQNASSTFRASEQTANTNAHWVQNIRQLAF